MGAPGVDISPEATAHAGQVLASSSDAAAAAGSALLAAGQCVTGTPEVGASIRASAWAFGDSLGGVCADLVESATGLASAIAVSAQTYSSVDAAATNSFGGPR